MDDVFMVDVKEAARRLGFGRSFVYQKFIQPGLLPSIKVGGARRVLLRDLHEFVERLRDESAIDGTED